MQHLFDIFLSHAGADHELAGALKALLSTALALPPERIFCSSDSMSMHLGQKMEPQIVTAHQQARVVVAIMTPNALLRPWVLLEAGGAHFQTAKRFYVLVANGVRAENLPGPLSSWQIGDLSKDTALRSLCTSIAQDLGCSGNSPSGPELSRVTGIASRGKNLDWHTITTALVVEQSVDSPFSLPRLLKDESSFAAKNRVNFFSRDLTTLARKFRNLDGARIAIFDWLRGGSKRKFRLTLADRGAASEDDKRVLARWTKYAPSENGATFIARLGNFVTEEIVFVDPKDPQGYAIITPRADNLGARPPLFVVRRDDGAAFDYYWSYYHDENLGPNAQQVSADL